MFMEVCGNSRKYSFNSIYGKRLERWFSNFSMPQSHLEDLFKHGRSTWSPRTCISNKFAGDDSGLAATL